VGLNWYTLVFPDDGARESVVKQLQQLGVNLQKEENYYTTSDPSGNQIRLVL
jgi:catechol 2,3-dioxygenase